jgi:hypothetical protein
MEFHKAKEFIDIGAKAAEESIPKIKSFIPYFKEQT